MIRPPTRTDRQGSVPDIYTGPAPFARLAKAPFNLMRRSVAQRAHEIHPETTIHRPVCADMHADMCFVGFLGHSLSTSGCVTALGKCQGLRTYVLAGSAQG